MKRWVVQFGRPDRCQHCGMRGFDALRGERETALLPDALIYRHPDCNHILFYRGGGSAMITPKEVEQPLETCQPPPKAASTSLQALPSLQPRSSLDPG